MTSSTQTATATATTFVQADKATFRDLVQKLTGLPGDLHNLPASTPSSSKLSPSTTPRRSPFKLHERRHAMRNKLEIKLGFVNSATGAGSPGKHRTAPAQHLKSPALSPVTPLGSELSKFLSRGYRDRDSATVESPESEEEKAIAEKRFYLHPSPMSTPRGIEPPELLPLFPLASPKIQESRCT